MILIFLSEHRGTLKDLLQALLEPIDVVVDQVLLVDLSLVDQANKCETGVNLSQVKHNVLLVVLVGKSDDARAFLVEFGSILLIVPIDAGHINQHVDQLRADFVVFHVDGRGVRCYVDL